MNDQVENEHQGAHVVNAVCGIQKIGTQIEALANLFEVLLGKDLPSTFSKEKGWAQPVRAEYLDDDGAEANWVYGRWLYQYLVAGGGERRLRNPIYVGLDFVLYYETIMSVVGKQPVILVAGNTEG